MPHACAQAVQDVQARTLLHYSLQAVQVSALPGDGDGTGGGGPGDSDAGAGAGDTDGTGLGDTS